MVDFLHFGIFGVGLLNTILLAKLLSRGQVEQEECALEPWLDRLEANSSESTTAAQSGSVALQHPEHVICQDCQRTVARYAEQNGQILCLNCLGDQ